MPRLWSDVAEPRCKELCRLVAMVAVVMAMTSCVNSPSEEGFTTSLGVTTVATDMAGTDSVEDAGTTVTSDPEREVASDQELEAVMAALPSVMPPTGDAAGSYRSFAIERIEFYAACLSEGGLAVEIDPVDLGVTYRIPDGQEDAYNRIKTDCRAATRERFGMTDHPRPADLERWYRAYAWTWRCLIEYGYILNDPPTMDSFVESGGSNWQPFAELMLSGGAPDGEVRRVLEQSCPQDVDYLIWFLRL